MASKSITGVFGTKLPSVDIAASRGEAIELTITLVNSVTPPMPHDGSGGYLNIAWRSSNTIGVSRRIRRKGRPDGVYRVTIPSRDVWYFIDGSYRWDVWFSRGGIDTPIIDVGSLVGLSAIGPGDLVDDEETDPAAIPPPIQQTIENVGVLDLPGNTLPLPTPAAVRAYYGSEVVIRTTIAQLQGTNVSPTATGTLDLVGADGDVVGTPIVLTQLTGDNAGIFEGTIGAAHQNAIAESETITYFVRITPTPGGTKYLAHQAGVLTFLATGLVLNVPPTVEITSPAAGALLAAGSQTILFSANDPTAGAHLNASNLALLVDDVVVAATITILTGNNTATVTGSAVATISAAGAHTVAVQCTDQSGDSDTAAISVTVQTLAIATPSAGTTLDEGPVVATVTATPAVAANTAVQLYVDGVASGSPGTVGSGATTAAMTAGSRTLTARIIVSGVTVESPERTITVAAEDATVTITSPAPGEQVDLGARTLSATVIPPAHGSVVSVQWRVAGGTWASMAQVGTSTTWQAGYTLTGADLGSRTVEVQSTDGGGGIVSASVTYTVWDSTAIVGEFNEGAKHYVIAPADLTLSYLQQQQYGARRYATLAAAIPAILAANETDEEVVLNAIGSWAAPEVVTRTGILINADAFASLLVRAMGPARTDGTFLQTAWRMLLDDDRGHCVTIAASNVTIDGMQFYQTTTPADNTSLIRQFSGANTKITNNLIAGHGNTSTEAYSAGIYADGTGTTLDAHNNVIYGWTSNGQNGFGICVANSTYVALVDNNTIRNCSRGVYQTTGSVTARNNIVQDCQYRTFEGTISGSNNVVDDAYGKGSPLTVGEVTFVDEASNSLQVAGANLIAIAGADLSSLYTDAINGSRTTWIAGAFGNVAEPILVRVIAGGDSFTEGDGVVDPAKRYPARLAVLGATQFESVVNEGHSGWTAAQFDTDFATLVPEHIAVDGRVNIFVAQGWVFNSCYVTPTVTPAEIVASLFSICDKARALGCLVVLTDQAVVADSFGVNAKMAEVYALVAAEWGAHADAYAVTRTVFDGPILSPELYQVDGLHPSPDDGMEALAALIYAALVPLF